jgi:LysM repeat protein
MGVGVAVAGGVYYYTLDVGYVAGSQPQSTKSSSGSVSGNPTQIAAQQATQAALPKPVFVSTPAEDGSVIHIVQQGQTLWTIAAKYNIPLADLLSRNNLTENSFVYPGNRLIIFPSNTPSPENSEQTTAAMVSDQPTITPTALLPSPTLYMTETPTKTPLKKTTTGFRLDPVRALLALFIGLIAIAAVIILSFTKDVGDGT